jgi:SPW repeat-containing protein
MEAAMMQIRFFDRHRNWEDWLGMLLGMLIGLSPWLSGQMGSQTMMVNAIIVGAMVFVLGELEAADLHRWQEGGEIVLGSWMAASPFIFGYSADGTLRFWHFVLGAAVVTLAVLELWQDWNLSNKELAEHDK